MVPSSGSLLSLLVKAEAAVAQASYCHVVCCLMERVRESLTGSLHLLLTSQSWKTGFGICWHQSLLRRREFLIDLVVLHEAFQGDWQE